MPLSRPALALLLGIAIVVVVVAACDERKSGSNSAAPGPAAGGNAGGTSGGNAPAAADPDPPAIKVTLLVGDEAARAVKGGPREGAACLDLLERGKLVLDDKPLEAETLTAALRKLAADKGVRKLTVRVARGVKPIYLQSVQASAGDAGLAVVEVVHFDPATKSVIPAP